MTEAVEPNRWSALLWMMAIFLFIPEAARCHAAQAVCAEVKIEIKQEMTLERQAFDAHMKISNGLSHISLEKVIISIRFSDEDGDTVLATNDPDEPSARFFIRVDSMTNISDVAGSGKIAPSTSADIHWLIIPAPGASKGLESGTLYYVGATISYTIGGESHITEVTPDYIFVKPMPKMILDYFLPSDVYGDDAFTGPIEAPVPFSLGVRVKNSGHGTARELKIESAQPKIIENEQGVLIGFAIQGSQVNGKAGKESLRVDFGDIAPGTSGTARWIMTCTLSGQFVNFQADFSHSDELGGELTSLVDAVETHLLVHDVRVDLPGRDQTADFLARDGDILRVYESESADTVVTDQSASSDLSYLGTQAGRPVYALSTPENEDFIFVRLSDPYHGNKVLHSAIRGDGKTIKSENIWLSKSRDGQNWEYSINLFDVATTGEYTIVLADPAAVPAAPVFQTIADITAIEGERISFIVQASDPDGTIPSLSVPMPPAGVTFTDQGDGSALFDWMPSIGQAGSYSITFKASDGGLTDTQRVAFTIRSIIDTDGDGMNDLWEMAHFGTLDRDGSGDVDGDGISDLIEYLAGSDPTAEDLAPTVPIISLPKQDGVVSTLTPELVIENSTDADDDALTYSFEVYADSGLTLKVAADRGVAETTGTTAWAVPVELIENQHYHWRVRASDGYSYSLWAYSDFFTNVTNDPPNAPATSFPPDDTDVDTLSPVLEVTGATDPDGDVLTGSFEVYADMAMTSLIVDVHGLVVPKDGVVRWNVDVPLADNTSFFWRALVADDQGLASQTDLATFTVATANSAPTVPATSLPGDGDEMPTTAVELVVKNAVDADGDALGYYFEIDTASGFNSTDKQTSVMIGQGSGTTAWPISNLQDHTTYYWRAMATDTAAPSQWVTSRFFVNTANDSPAVPILKNPGREAWVGDLTPELSLSDGLDPDLDSLSYRYEIYTEPTLENLVSWSETLSTRWTVATELTDKTRYYWRARVIDEHGSNGNWMPTASFFLNEQEPLQPEVITVHVSTDKGRSLDNIRVYAFTAAGTFTGIYATTGPDGKAIFDIDALSPTAYRFRADYLGRQFWSPIEAIPETFAIPILIEEEAVTVTADAASGAVTGTRVYLYSESGAYLGIYQQIDANGQVFFDLPVGETFLFRTDILGSQFWSGAITVLGGAINTVRVDAGGGRLQVVVRQDETTAIPGIRIYLFSVSGAYLGLSGATGENGTVGFNVPEADYRLRADYLGYQFWSEPVHVIIDSTQPIEIAHQSSQITIQGRFGESYEPIPAIPVYLFSGSNIYLGQTQQTGVTGQVRFDLPQKAYRVRVDYLGSQYWSEPFTWEDPMIAIPLADAQVRVSCAGLPKAGVPVYVFSASGSYLGVNGITDDAGQITFRLPEGRYDFRADYQSNQIWAKDRLLAADVVNDVDIAVGGGTFQLTIKTGTDAPLVGVKCHVFNESDVYLGLAASTADGGVVTFDLADGAYRFRVDYLGHQFWSEPFEIPGSISHTMIIPETQVHVHVISAQAAVPGAKVHLFSDTDAYLGSYATTDDSGKALFDLPNGINCRFRADILGNQYWSGDAVVSTDASPVVIDAGGGRLRTFVETDTGSPFAGLPINVFSESGHYLGLSETTASDGSVSFNLPRGTYHIRTDYMGYSFWEEEILVAGDTDVTLIIPLLQVLIDVKASYQGWDSALAGIPVHLFTDTGAYLGQSAETNEQGRVTFDLPKYSYTVRVDFLGGQHWSGPFAWENITLRIPMADAAVSVTGAGLPAAGVDVFLFSLDDAYLGQVMPTDDQGTAIFRVPAGSFSFRADYQGNQYWSRDAFLEADTENPILIGVGGGSFSLVMEKDDNTPMTDINSYVFGKSGSYLGLKGSTGPGGRVSYELATGIFNVRADYLGYQYWSGPLIVPDTLTHVMVVDHADTTVTFQGQYQGVKTPLDQKRVYLFSPSGSYLGRHRDTDSSGQAVFNLPNQTYEVRCDYLGRHYWSGTFQLVDTTVTVPQGKTYIHATRAGGDDAENARVYLFDGTDSYLGRYEHIDGEGNAQFILPEGQYRFRVDLDGRQQWTDITTVIADSESTVDIVLE